MKLHKFFAAICTVSMMGNTLFAAPPTTPAEAIAQFNADAALLTGWINTQFVRAIPFNSTAGNVVPSQLKLFGFEVGGEFVASGTKIDTDALHALPTQVVDTHQIDVSDRVPIPMVLGHAKIGLPWGLDGGLRLGGIPKNEHDDGDTHLEVVNSVFGLDLRKALIEEGATRPFGLTLGASFTHAKGHISGTTNPSSLNTSNVTFGTDALSTTRTDWNSKSAGLQALMNKKILFMNPYIGASANKNWGTMDTSNSNTGSFTVLATPGSLNGTGANSSEKINSWDTRGLFGIEFTCLPFLKMNLGGEYGSEGNLAGNFGLRVQFH
jgi:hypothetical protein